ncbi:MAG TPA: efflux RND transporter permease subunit [Candidatus Eisenbacteria bacterium]|nr:efflux RND transporter permease subunit [Candidatus Eisenbacteria bacterium]
MFRWIVGSSLKYRFIVLAIAGALMLVGADQMRDMPVDVFPEFAPPIVEIQTPCLGLSPTEVEALVTIPLEQALAGLPDLDILRSKSVTDLSSVKMIFKRGSDPMAVRQHVQEGLALVIGVIPKDVGPPVMLQPLSATARFMKIGVSSKTVSMVDQSMIAYWTIRPRLLAVKGVANVAIWGERIKMPQVQVDPARLRQHGVTVEQVMDATSDALEAGLMTHSDGAMIGTGGFIATPNQQIGIRNKLSIVDPDGLGEVSITGRGGERLQLKDVAVLTTGHQPLVGDGVINGGEGLLLIVEKFPWANTLQVTKGVDDALASLKPGLPNLTIDPTIFRPASFVEISIHNLSKSLLLGCLLVVMVLALFLLEWRVALITCVAIPLSLMAAMLVLYLTGTTINTMILAGFVIALGALVDDAIIDIENVMRRLREHRRTGGTKSIARVILDSSLEVRQAIVYATLIDVVALLPVFFLGGLSGAFFQPLAVSYSLSLLASMFVALTVTPAMALILLSKAPLREHDSPVVRWLQHHYSRALSTIVPRPKAIYATVAVVVLAGAIVFPRLGQSLLPDFKERDFLMHWLTEPGTSVTEEFRISAAACDEIMKIPGVRNSGSHIGQALIMDEVYGVYFGENWISIDPSVDYDKTLKAVQSAVDGYPGLVRDVQTYLKERIREVLTGSPTAITIRIFGDDLKVLRAKADSLKHAMEDVPGVVDLKVESLKEIAQIDVKVDLERAYKYGIKPGDVRRTAAAMVTGTEVGDIFRDGKAYDVNVWSIPECRNSVSDIQNMLVDTPEGGQMRLSELADVKLVATPNAVERWQMKRKIDVRANVRGRDLGSVVRDVEKKVAAIEFPKGYHPEMLGEYAERQAAQKRMRTLTVVAVLGVLLLLQASFMDWRLALVGFLALPAALVGGVLAAFLGDGVISLGTTVGFLTVLGIAARNGIMLINHYQHLERHEGEPFGLNLVIRGARERISPIMMTVLCTGLALVPLLVAGTIPGHEIEHPMAVVIMGGLVTSTLLNLFILPTLYLRFARPMKPATTPMATA